MKNIIKTLIVMLSSISLFASANAGELSVSGTAKATYNIESGSDNGKGLGITNELNFTASGETDAGYTWSYSMELDPGATAVTGATDNESLQSAQNDDTKLTLSTPFGTVGVFISEGGLDVEDSGSQSVYSRPTDMGGSDGVTDNYSISSYNNLQYHTAADMIPFGGMFKVGYAPDLDAYGSGNNAGPTQTEGTAAYAGRSATQYQVSFDAIPFLDGVKIGADYMEFDKAGDEGKKDQLPESGAYYATYSIGNVSLGYSEGWRAQLMADDAADTATTVEQYDQTNMSIAYAINDDLSVSYEVEKSTAVTVGEADTDVEQKSTGIQLAYNMGGMTLALVRNSHDNPSYSSTAADEDQTLIAVTMAF